MEIYIRTEAGDGGTRISEMTTLNQDPQFTFRFAEDRIIPRFHLEGVEVGWHVSVFKIDPDASEAFIAVPDAEV